MTTVATRFAAIEDTELEYAFKHGEFSPSLRGSAPKLVVVMTQDWCPQWVDMQSWLGDFSDEAKILVVVYNKHPMFQRIMEFKETTFGNFEIPYARYYHKGELITHTNWMPRGTFQALLKKEKAFSLR